MGSLPAFQTHKQFFCSASHCNCWLFQQDISVQRLTRSRQQKLSRDIQNGERGAEEPGDGCRSWPPLARGLDASGPFWSEYWFCFPLSSKYCCRAPRESYVCSCINLSRWIKHHLSIYTKLRMNVVILQTALAGVLEEWTQLWGRWAWIKSQHMTRTVQN